MEKLINEAFASVDTYMMIVMGEHIVEGLWGIDEDDHEAYIAGLSPEEKLKAIIAFGRECV